MEADDDVTAVVSGSCSNAAGAALMQLSAASDRHCAMRTLHRMACHHSAVATRLHVQGGDVLGVGPTWGTSADPTSSLGGLGQQLTQQLLQASAGSAGGAGGGDDSSGGGGGGGVSQGGAASSPSRHPVDKGGFAMGGVAMAALTGEACCGVHTRHMPCTVAPTACACRSTRGVVHRHDDPASHPACPAIVRTHNDLCPCTARADNAVLVHDTCEEPKYAAEVGATADTAAPAPGGAADAAMAPGQAAALSGGSSVGDGAAHRRPSRDARHLDAMFAPPAAD
jgi:hypothetical protein